MRPRTPFACLVGILYLTGAPVTPGITPAFEATVVAQTAAARLDACSLLTVDEFKTAFGRKDLGAATPGRASGGYSDCRFPGMGLGDVRVTLSPILKTAKDDFDLKPQILKDEGKRFEKVSGIGDDAYYWTIPWSSGLRTGSCRCGSTARRRLSHPPP